MIIIQNYFDKVKKNAAKPKPDGQKNIVGKLCPPVIVSYRISWYLMSRAGGT